MKFKKLKRSIEKMPRPAYIFLKSVLSISAAMLFCSLALFVLNAGEAATELEHLAQVLLESPAGVLLLGAVGLAFILDRC